MATKMMMNPFEIHKPSLLYHQQKPWWDQILDPNGEFITRWHRIFLFTSLFALFVDPLFFYLPTMHSDCMTMDYLLLYLMMFSRTTVDLFSILHIAMKFRTAYIQKSTRVFGKGDLIEDPHMIAMRYLKTDFAIDFAASLPLPQIVIWSILPHTRDATAAHANHSISLVIILQYIPRLFVIFPLNRRIIKNTGVVAKTAWSGAAYNMLIFILASHVLGSSWYLMAFEKAYSCWRELCKTDEVDDIHCSLRFLDCGYVNNERRVNWRNKTDLFAKCDQYAKSPNPDADGIFNFGMFADIRKDSVSSASMVEKCFYCLWWGLSNLSSYGQNIKASTSVVETLFGSLICLMGLVFFALLIGNIQTYMQSLTARLEEWRVKRRDTEEWMRHRQLPLELQERVRRFVQYQWLATRGVDEEEILQALPMDLRRQIQRHLCLALVRRVPFFSQMDGQLLDAICERLVSSLNTKDTYIVREGDPVNEMLFIIRGQLESSTTNGGRSGFFNTITLKPGDFCGEELLTWALMPATHVNLPSSTRTVLSITEVEAFALRAEDLKYVANQFKRLHSKKLQYAFRYYSHQWRTWGACFLQTAWRMYMRRKLADELVRQESTSYITYEDESDYSESIIARPAAPSTSSSVSSAVDAVPLRATVLASKFAAQTRPRGPGQKAQLEPSVSSINMPKKLFKPDDPDFSHDQEPKLDREESINL